MIYVLLLTAYLVIGLMLSVASLLLIGHGLREPDRDMLSILCVIAWPVVIPFLLAWYMGLFLGHIARKIAKV